ncbi:MAG: hypothetical protein KF834_04215 [Burkholderiales bacterium]|nr:hypothetical protein [Burkholderiales bacterium]
MRFNIYFGVTGDKQTITSFHSELQLPGSETRALVPKDSSKSGQDSRWAWRTKYIPVTSGFPEDALRDLLLAHKQVLPLLDKYRSHLTEIGAFIIAQHDDDEDLRGYSFSKETIKLLAEFDASLELDSVRLMETGNNKS